MKSNVRVQTALALKAQTATWHLSLAIFGEDEHVEKGAGALPTPSVSPLRRRPGAQRHVFDRDGDRMFSIQRLSRTDWQGTVTKKDMFLVA